MDSKPLVSVGLPTYNRAPGLKRAIESVLDQDYSNFELVISDNASTDETEALCLEFQRHDNRVHYLRQQTNQGPIANFQAVFDQAQGQFFMWLGDDDWLDHNYISRCVAYLREHPDHSLACGTVKYFRAGKCEFQGEIINLPQESGAERVRAYYRKVHHNGTFHGLSRREQLGQAPLHNTVGADWLLVASLAFMGKVATIEDILVSRGLGGATRDMESMASTMEMSPLEVKLPHLAIARSAFKDVVRKSPAYRSLGPAARYFLGLRVLLGFGRRFMLGYCYQLSYPYWSRPILLGVSLKKKTLQKLRRVFAGREEGSRQGRR